MCLASVPHSALITHQSPLLYRLPAWEETSWLHILARCSLWHLNSHTHTHTHAHMQEWKHILAHPMKSMSNMKFERNAHLVRSEWLWECSAGYLPVLGVKKLVYPSQFDESLKMSERVLSHGYQRCERAAFSVSKWFHSCFYWWNPWIASFFHCLLCIADSLMLHHTSFPGKQEKCFFSKRWDKSGYFLEHV